MKWFHVVGFFLNGRFLRCYSLWQWVNPCNITFIIILHWKFNPCQLAWYQILVILSLLSWSHTKFVASTQHWEIEILHSFTWLSLLTKTHVPTKKLLNDCTRCICVLTEGSSGLKILDNMDVALRSRGKILILKQKNVCLKF